MAADTVFKLWLRGSLALFAAFVIWNYMPILIPLGVVVGVLAAFTWGVRRFAARYQKPDLDES